MAEYESTFGVGQLVRIDRDVTGVVDRVSFNGNGAVYRVEWWVNGELRCGDFHEYRLSDAELSNTVLSRIRTPVHADNDESGGAEADTTYRVGRWLSAALDDPQVCDEMKADIRAWMKAGRPNVQPPDEQNMATFHAFKRSGKWYSTERAYLTPMFFREFPDSRRERLLGHMPNRCYPGLNSAGREFTWVIVPDENHENGFPVMLRPEENEE